MNYKDLMIREKIFSIFDRGDGIVVFPTENTARYYLSEYARERKKAVLASRALAFDNFSALFSPESKDRRPANRYHRLAFVSSFLKTNGSLLKYFYNPAYPESRESFVSFFTKALSELSFYRQTYTKSKALVEDIDLLYKSYSDFLDKNQLFDPTYEKHSVANCKTKLEKKYYFVGYECEAPMQQLFEELGDELPFEKVVLTFEKSQERAITIYENENAELKGVFDELYALLASGVNIEDISLSSPAIDRLKPRLEREAERRLIPLSFPSSLTLSETVPGSYLVSLSALISEGMSFLTLSSFLLNTAYPYEEEKLDLNRQLIDFMIERGISAGSTAFTSTSDELYRALSQGKNAKLLEHYKTLKGSLANLKQAGSGAQFSSSIHKLTSYLFGEEEFRGNEDDRNIFSFILREAESFSQAALCVGQEIPSFFTLFVTEVKKLSYVKQNQVKGVRVVPYGQDYLLDLPYRFVFALSSANTSRIVKPLSFLEAYELVVDLDKDESDAFLFYYQNVSEHTYLSSSKTTYDGEAQAPFYFTEKQMGMVDPKDKTFLRARSYEAGRERAFNKASEADILPNVRIPYKAERVVSYSLLDKYIGCPFRTFVLEMLKVDEDSQFEPALFDHKEVGTFLHGVVEDFLNQYLGQTLTMEKMAEYEAVLTKLFRENLAKSFWFNSYTKNYLSSFYEKKVVKFISDLLAKYGPSVPVETEKRLSGEKDGIKLKGFADVIIESSTGKAVIDLKKGNAKANAKSYQITLYKYLDKDLTQGSYYSFKDSLFEDQKNEKEAEEQLETDLKAFAEGTGKGLWDFAKDRKVCASCAQVGICRRRFFAK